MLTAATLGLLLFWALRAPSRWHRLQGLTMGTFWHAQFELPRNQSKNAIETDIRAELERLQKTLSVFDPQSEISALNASKSQRFSASEMLFRVMEQAMQVSALSDGAFDITTAPLIDAWGFGPAKREDPPDDLILSQIKRNVGFRQIALDPQTRAIVKQNPETTCNLSAIAKGYGVDKIAELLESKGIFNYLVEIGGEIRVSGQNPEGQLWKLGIAHPEGQSAAYLVLKQTGGALATSGDYFNYREINGKRVSHTIDPRTGKPIEHSLTSVSVWAKDCMTADAWATALNVLGPKEGLDRANQLHLAAYLIERNEEGLRALPSQAWIQVFGDAP